MDNNIKLESEIKYDNQGNLTNDPRYDLDSADLNDYCASSSNPIASGRVDWNAMKDLDLSKMNRTQRDQLKTLLTPKMTKYIPHTPYPKQQAFLLLDTREAFYGGAAGGGKALALDTPVRTMWGMVPIGEIEVGQRLYNANYELTEVVAVSDIMYNHDVYDVWIQTHTTTERVIIKADAEHLWTLDTGEIINTEEASRRQFSEIPLDLPLVKGSKNSQQVIARVIKTESVPVRCIKIACPTGLFLVTQFDVPTHNSDALLMAALQYVDVPGYAAILFRKSYADLVKPGALIDRAKDWLLPHEDVKWVERERKFVFNYGDSILQFGYLDNDNDRFAYQGGEYQFAGFDELTHMTEVCYRYLFSRTRRLANSKLPIRIRSASNPGGRGHAWVKNRLITQGKKYGRVFIPAKLQDNAALDAEEYLRALSNLDPVERARLASGDWEVKTLGSSFDRNNFPLIDFIPHDAERIRFWDFAATIVKKKPTGKALTDPDWTVGIKVAFWKGIYAIEDIIRFRKLPHETELIVQNTAKADGVRTRVRYGEEPGSAGLMVTSHFARNVLRGYDFAGIKEIGKGAMASPVASASALNLIMIKGGIRNYTEFMEELETFPVADHDDCVDALSGAYFVFNEHNYDRTNEYAPGALMEQQLPRMMVTKKKKIWTPDDRDAEVGFGDLASGFGNYSKWSL